MRTLSVRFGSTWLLCATFASLALFTLAPPTALAGPLVACNDAAAPACMGTCAIDQLCIAISRGGTAICTCRNVGCCRLDANTCQENVPALTCLAAGGSWGRGENCASGCQPSGDPIGTACSDATDCQSDSCVDGVCCDGPCDQPEQVCNLPGREGVCSGPPAQTPAISSVGLMLSACVLLAIAALALLRRRAR